LERDLLSATLVLGAAALTASVGSGCPGNRLANPGFENGFAAHGRPQEIVANGWLSWYDPLPGTGGIHYAPVYTPRRSDRDGPRAVLAGLWSQELATTSSTHLGGLMQQVAIPLHSQVLATAFAYAWASDGDNPAISEPQGLYAVSLGLDPEGGMDPAANTIEWTRPVSVTDSWVPLELDVGVEGPWLTLFLRGEAAAPLAHNVARWDEACLRILGPEGKPTPWPSRTPKPTRTLAPGEATPTPGPATQQALAREKLAGIVASATAAAQGPGRSGAFRVTLEPLPTATATRVPPAPSGARRLATAVASVRGEAGLLFLGGAALLAGLLVGTREPPESARVKEKVE